SDNNLYESFDSGAHWAPNSFFSPGSGYLNAVAFAGTGGTVYALDFHAFYASADSGATWALVTYLPFSPQFCLANNITLDSSNPTTIYLGDGSIYYDSGCAAMSTDGGATWAELTFPSYGSIFAVDPKSPSTVYSGSHNGLYKSTDAGTTWTPVNIAGLV